MARLLEKYKKEIVPQLVKEFSYTSIMRVPRLEKIVVSSSGKDIVLDAKLLDKVRQELSVITGQASAVTRAKKAIANFKLRKGVPIGAMVTLRRKRMYEFLDRLVNVSLPRVRDFKGVSTRAFDGRGNYTLGIKEQIIFPEIEIDSISKFRGMNITVVTTAKTDEECRALLTKIGMPFRKQEK
ncbi:MAG: 50S ribosomal protein L5 [Deltaproteobacteria bacterium RIFCSPHIGHO2_12_FULL_43_9]|nr:MAG: 50S ribosomal protein L5 [Deltaproteobacteria bacterium RIFCSPHIGHO2_12_FULL_43_9]